MSKRIEYRYRTGTLIRNWRERRGISQAQLSKILKLSTAQSVSNIERGITPLPAKHISKIAKAFGVPQKKVIRALLNDEYRRIVRSAREGARQL